MKGSAVRSLLAAAALSLPALIPAPAGAQVPYYVLDPQTRVSSLAFSFPEGRSFTDEQLIQHMVTTAPSWIEKTHRKLAFLPFVSAPGGHRFAPIDLQRDVARLRAFYATSGFIGTDIRYEVDFDEEDDAVAVDMIITEGRPIILDTVRMVTTDGRDLTSQLPDSLNRDWADFGAKHRPGVGHRYSQSDRALLVGNVLEWWTSRGWPFAKAESTLDVDSVRAEAALTVRVDPGPRARVSEIRLEGNDNVSSHLILRALPFHEGDWFSSDLVAEAQQRLFGLDLFRLVLVDVPPDQPHDSTVDVRVRVQESPPRLLTGEIGYVSSGGGLTARAELAHRNFLGGARTLRLDALAQTGMLSVTEQPEREYRLSLSFRRPFTFNPRTTLTVAPFASYRDNLIDRSWETGVTTGLVYQVRKYSFLTLQHEYSARHVFDYRFGSTRSIDLAELIRLAGVGALDTLDNRIDRSTLTLSGTLGRYDPTIRRGAIQGRPSVEVTTPARLNTIEYADFDVPVIGYLPLGRGFALAARARYGRLYPFGKTLRGDSIAGLLQAAQLRGVLLTAGGTGSVRGWGNGMVGPKFPNLVLDGSSDTTAVQTDGYVPSGGLARASGSFEVRMPFPFLDETWGTHVFLDAGRVWRPDVRLQGPDPYGEYRWFYGTGAGIDVSTPVGPIRVSVGYKLNPSPLDVRDARDVFAALAAGRPVSSVPTDWKRRLHLHIALGSAF